MIQHKLLKAGAVAGACAAVGAGAGILGSAGAAPAAHPHAGVHRGIGAARGPLRRAVHVEAVVPRAGGRFVTVTLDRGKLLSIQGNQLQLTEGTIKAPYKTVTITVPANAVVRDNGSPSQLSSLKAGQRVMVFQGPKLTRVAAHNARN